ncbi:hypothetical protein LCGC14_0548540 [marine sediment metagenome]|uniref:Uncharacterized protein n=1 Tax=marine sediment metagenome TaxID=412755 RepID=A0A0F9RVE7_9ZZZZ
MYFSPSCECGTKLEVIEKVVITNCYAVNSNGNLKKKANEYRIIQERKLKCPNCWKTYPLLVTTPPDESGGFSGNAYGNPLR